MNPANVQQLDGLMGAMLRLCSAVLTGRSSIFLGVALLKRQILYQYEWASDPVRPRCYELNAIEEWASEFVNSGVQYQHFYTYVITNTKSRVQYFSYEGMFYTKNKGRHVFDINIKVK